MADVCSINMGQSPESSSYNETGDGLPFFQGNADFGDRYPITRVWCNSPTKIAHAGDILISVRAPIGAMNYASEDCCIGRGLAAITPDKSRVLPEFIYWLLKGKNAELNRKGTGSTFKAIGRKVLEEVLVPDISVEEQTSIAFALETVYNIIQSRKQQLLALDTLTKARFAEMFGDPVSNTMGWEQTVMKSICSKITDGEHGSVPRVEIGHPFLNAKHIRQDGSIDWGTITYTSNEVHKKLYKRCNPEPGDILMTTTGTIGNVAIVPAVEAFSMDRGITLMKINTEKVTSKFIAWLLRYDAMQNIMAANVHASAIGHLFLNKVEQLPVIIPPVEAQEQFTAFVSQVDKSKALIQTALNKTQLLFDSSMQKYFG